MAHKKSLGLSLAILLLASSGVAAAQLPAQASRLAGDWRSSDAVAIPASSPAIRPPINLVAEGPAPAGMKLERMLLLLSPSADQQQALTAELGSLENPSSPHYHQWLTPASFAATYSNSAADVGAVSAWLESQGFQVAPLPAGRGWIEFSGTVAQVDQAFHTQINSVITAGGTRAVLAEGISIPAALAPVVQGLVSLDGALSTPALTTPQLVAVSAAELAAETSPNRAEALTPQLAAQLLHLDALHRAGIDGAGESIAIAARSNVNSQDVAAFRAAFSLPATPPLMVIPNGSDPGATSDQAEATLAASWAGAAAPGARIVVVPAATTSATDGLDLSLAAIVDQALAHAVAVGYSECEAALSQPHQAFYSALYRQAAAEGIAVIAAAGDSGPSACHLAGSDAPVSSGYGVNALASTSWNTAVGVAAFGAAGPAAGISALAAWSPANTTDPAYAGGGGSSTLYAAPIWQTVSKTSQQGTDGAGNNNRLLPDLALPTGVDSNVNHGLAFCLSGLTSTAGASSGCTLARSGGSSAASAIFAGVAALVAQKYGAQGNMAPHLYALSRQSGIFEDVQQGSAQLKCVAGSPGCGATEQIGFAASPGYDLATGLGAVNAQELVTHWATPDVAAPVTVTIGITPVQLDATYNPTALVTLTSTVTPVTAGATPTGTITFYNTTTASALTGPSTVTLDPSATGTWIVNLDSIFTTAGMYSIGASYFDEAGTYASTNSEPITVTTAPSTTTLTVTPSNLTPTVGTTITVTVTLGVSATGPPAGAVAPTGTVTLNINGVAFGTSPVATVGMVTTATFTSVPVTATAHTLQAVYAGDANYTTATGMATITVVTVLPDTVVLTSNISPVPFGAAVILTATVTPNTLPLAGAEQNPTGSVVFYNGTMVIGEAALVPVPMSDSSMASITTQTLPGGFDMLTAIYLGDTSYDTETSNVLTLGVQSFTLTPSPSNPPTNVDIVQGQSGTASFVITGLGGLDNEIQVICAVPSQDDMTCTATPQQIVPPGTVTFTIQTFLTGGPSASNNHREPIWPRAAGGTALAVLGFFLLPFGRRARVVTRILARRSTRRFLVLLLLMAGLCGAGIGCNSVAGLVVPTGGTPLGVATLKITAAAYVDNTVVSQSVFLTVNVLPAP